MKREEIDFFNDSDDELELDPVIESAISALSVSAPEESCEIYEKIVEEVLSEYSELNEEDQFIQLRWDFDQFGFSYAGVYDIEVRNPNTAAGYEGTMQIRANDLGTAFDASLTFTFVGDSKTYEIEGSAYLEDQILRMHLKSPGSNTYVLESFAMHNTSILSPVLMGGILCQQTPDRDPLNGDMQMKPKQQDAGKTSYTVIFWPRVDANGNPVYSGTGPNRKPVMDAYFYRNGKWHRIKDPSLRVQGKPGLIDLRDGSPNPNHEPAGSDVSDKLNRKFFPTGWDKFWKGFNEATARQLQGLSVTLQAMTGVDIRLWKKIKQRRCEGKTWTEIFEEFKYEILYHIAVALAFGAFLKKIFGPFASRARQNNLARLRSGQRPRILPRPFRKWLEQLIRNLERKRRQIRKTIRELERERYTGSLSRREREIAVRLHRKALGEVNRELNTYRRALNAVAR